MSVRAVLAWVAVGAYLVGLQATVMEILWLRAVAAIVFVLALYGCVILGLLWVLDRFGPKGPGGPRGSG